MRRSRLYLLASALRAAETAGALRFVALPGRLSLLSFQLLPVSELPLQHLGAMAVGTALALRRGAAKTAAGRAGLTLSAASAAGLIELERRGRESRRHLEAALVVGLGADYHSMIRRPPLAEPGAAVPPRAGVVRIWRSAAAKRTMPTSPTAPTARRTCSTSGADPTFRMTPAPRCCSRPSVARGSPAQRAAPATRG